MVPEALFHPSDIGIRQAGIGECIGNCLSLFPPGIQELLSRNIILSGGNSCIPRYKERVEQEVMPYIEEGRECRVFQMNDPIGDTWRGGALLAQEENFRNVVISREMYEENGPLRLLTSAFQKNSCV